MTGKQIAHGENKGYQQGCREDCCTQAHRWYMHQWRSRVIRHGHVRVPAIGLVRRIQALSARGWTGTDIARESKTLLPGNIRALAMQKNVHPTTFDAICRAYDALSMLPMPEGPKHHRARNMAARKGWPPPLAWDDDTIDDPQAEAREWVRPQVGPPLSGRPRVSRPQQPAPDSVAS